MKRALLVVAASATGLFCQSSVTCDGALGYFNNLITNNGQEGFNSVTLGLGLRVEDNDSVLRIGLAKAISTNGYNSATIASVANFQTASLAYSWKLSKRFSFGIGGRYTESTNNQPDLGPHPSMSSVRYGKNSSILPELAFEWGLGSHFKIGLNTSVVQNFIEFRGVL